MSPEGLALLLTAAHALVVLTAALYISARRSPSAAIAWILAIAFIPVVGILWFLIVGAGRLPRRRREQQLEVNRRMLERTPGEWEVGHRDEWPESLASAARLNLTLGALPVVGGTRAALEGDYAETFRRMIVDIDAASSTVHVEFFILVLDDTTRPFIEALGRASARGVTVRVLSDHLSGFLYPHRRATLAALADAGAEWRAMLPLRPLRGQWQRADLRNHRKLVTVDGRIGWTGSLNLIDSSYLKPKNLRRGLHWKELMVRVEGPVVRELDAVFVTDWYSETQELLPLDETPITVPATASAELLDAQVVPSGPSFENDNNLKLFVYLLQNARERISITSPYFVPDESTQLAILTAAARGVAVELFVSEIGDQFMVYHAQRSYYEALLRAGVRIHLYPPPTVLHSKHFSIDDDLAVIGSSNMDIRSFSLNMEVSLLVQGRTFVDALREVEDAYRATSRELTLDEWVRRPARSRALDSLMRLTSSLQ
ncbi:MAG: cardiolipin synthase [Leifsonia xyli]|nr:MAG: cardiolipin synthase [Leifsonia xyli]